MITPLEDTCLPFAHNNGIRIHYQVEGTGPPLLMHHGSGGSGSDWRDLGYTDPLKGDYRLILIDARGAGASDKPHEAAAYDIAMRASDVTAVLDHLEVSQAHYFGYSLGGWIGFVLARYAPDRFSSLILGGAHPYPENMQPYRDLMPPDMGAFLASMEKVYGAHLTPAMRSRLEQTDLRALQTMTQDRPSLADTLPHMKMPCLLFVGEADPRFPDVQECVSHLADVTYFSLPGLDHASAFLDTALVLPHVKAFLAKVSQTS
jgi:pimeloyl-ACP methyl ester carboxylesterase